MTKLEDEIAVHFSMSLSAAYAILDALNAEIANQLDWANNLRMTNCLSPPQLERYDEKVAELKNAKDDVIGAILIATRTDEGQELQATEHPTE